MPPIPVHIDDPITPSKPHDEPSLANTGTSTTAYPPAQPGAAAAAPAPTTYIPNAQPNPTPTRTAMRAGNSPPPPAPGAVPVPPGHNATVTAPSTLPPPPKAGETAALKQSHITQPPPQMIIPPPQSNYAPVHGTTPTTQTQARDGPTTINFGAAPAPQTSAGSHPPGYHQDTNAQELSSAARASLDQHERRESFANNLGFGGGDSANDTAANVWNTVKGWANTAGNSLAEAEKQVWERINKK
ncbi:uncharacterized protein MYCFIDRAFT_62671 [Pseudocercospora fijiensis CIRAD86]|uniref:Uncharacterized protein n=1 Tax=Pseudocercospora fijiensis (strain CIRAD86) TaxID=383855 RepID=N1Q6M7_PSEFD|nr:uncharacterized protein MYCFIDRAFT_62671 [Pseudocercospora fijiensis CIRAD86]EME88104.1 hypothetical protein MYCFIDRAFT_62671 [Pseudocercospora fijiensis CIRAD86]